MITQSDLKDRLCYNPDTGLFTYVKTVAQMVAGSIAGRPNTNGHVQISINNKRYMAHNLAWLYMTGEYPIEFLIDHKNTIYDDNRWCNLRKASYTQNSQNKSLVKNNKSGFKGVSYKAENNKYVAQISINGKKTHLGYTDTPEEAHALYVAAAKLHFGEFYNADS